MNHKVIIIGASTTGKSTLVTYLRSLHELPVAEIDEELIKRNGGTYPHDAEYKMQVLSPAIVNDVLHSDNIIFFTNTHYFLPENLGEAYSKGFRIIQLVLDREEMERRNVQRVEHEGYDDLSIYFDNMITYQQEIQEKGLVDYIINTNRSREEIQQEVLSLINQ